MVQHAAESRVQMPEAILAPWVDDPALIELVSKLKAADKRVLWELPGQTGDMTAMGCVAVIKKSGSEWVVE